LIGDFLIEVQVFVMSPRRGWSLSASMKDFQHFSFRKLSARCHFGMGPRVVTRWSEASLGSGSAFPPESVAARVDLLLWLIVERHDGMRERPVRAF
jgi:hypothetical protein